MRNDELYSPGCLDDHAKRLVLAYALRGVIDDRGCYSEQELLAAQHRVYKEWLAAVRETTTGFDCSFYEWAARGDMCDAAFVFAPGDLVKHNGRYCVVAERITRSVSWTEKWRIVNGVPRLGSWPQPMAAVVLKEADGSRHSVNAFDLEPADIPPEVFALVCGRAKDCPMMKGGRDGE